MSAVGDVHLQNVKRQWVTTLCGCRNYRNRQGQSMFCPAFCPTAMICSNMSAGKVCSKVNDESPICCELGPKGLCVCLGTLPIGAYHPLAGMLFFCAFTHHLRALVIAKYNVEEEKVFPCDCLNTPCMEFLHFGCNYPCSLFQMYVSLLEWQSEPQKVAAVHSRVAMGASSTIIVATPVTRVQPVAVVIVNPVTKPAYK